MLKYQISWKCVQWQSSWCHADGKSDMTKLTVAFRNVANAPNKRIINKYWQHVTENIFFVTESQVRATVESELQKFEPIFYNVSAIEERIEDLVHHIAQAAGECSRSPSCITHLVSSVLSKILPSVSKSSVTMPVLQVSPVLANWGFPASLRARPSQRVSSVASTAKRLQLNLKWHNDPLSSCFLV
jgi:hypothetical protein